MAIVTVGQLEEHLGLPEDTALADTGLLADKIAAAQGHLERLLGYAIEDEFGGQDQPDIPEPLREAVLQLAAWWYEQREAAITGTIVARAPHSIDEIVQEYREFTF